MRKIILVLVFIGFWSCGSDDSAKPQDYGTLDDYPMEGVWRTVSMTANNETTTYIDCSTPENGMLPNITGYHFRDDYTFGSFNICEMGDHGSETYSVSKHVLTLTTPEMTSKANIYVLGANHIIISYFWNSIDGDVLGTSMVLEKSSWDDVLSENPPISDYNLFTTWELTDMEIDGEPAAFGDCERNTTFTFLANSNFNGELYENMLGSCESTSLSGTWEKIDRDSYSMTTSDGISMMIHSISATTIALYYNKQGTSGEQSVGITLTKQ